MQLRLYGRRQDLDDLDVFRVLCFWAGKLRAERPHERVRGGFGCAIVGAAGKGDEGEAGGDHDYGCGLGGEGDEVREEEGDQMQGGEVIGCELGGMGG